MHSANKLSNLRRRVNRARKFPDNTCPASRHLHEMADELLNDKYKEEDDIHFAESILSVLESLWKARSELAKLK